MLAVAGVAIWLMFWNAIAWLGNMRLRDGQTAIAVAGDHNPALYSSGMHDVMAGVQLERLALACSLLSLLVVGVGAAILFLRPRLGSSEVEPPVIARGLSPQHPRSPSVAADQPALLGVGTIDRPVASEPTLAES